MAGLPPAKRAKPGPKPGSSGFHRSCMLTLDASKYPVIPEKLLEPFIPSHITFACGQLEKGSTTGYEHWQCYVEFKGPKSRAFIKEILGDETAHIEERYSTNAQTCRNYVLKSSTLVPGPNSRFELGQISQQGHRSDLDTVRDEIRAGHTLAQVADSHFGLFARYGNALAKYKGFHDARTADQDRIVKTHVYWGKAGTGKTWAAINDAASVSGGVKGFKVRFPDGGKSNKVWFDGYEGQLALVIDDYKGNNFSITTLCHLLDRYPLQLDVKFSYTYAKWTHVYITSNIPPEQWTDPEGPLHPDHQAALLRRLHHVVEFKSRGRRVTHKNVEPDKDTTTAPNNDSDSTATPPATPPPSPKTDEVVIKTE